MRDTPPQPSPSRGGSRSRLGPRLKQTTQFMQSTSVGSVTCLKSKKSPLVAGITRGKCRRPLLELGASSAGDGVEGGVDEAGGVVFVKGPGDIDIFGDDHLGGDILAAQQLEGGGAQNGA